MKFWSFTFDGIKGSASSYQGCTLIFWNGQLYELGSTPIDLKQAALSVGK